MFHAFADRFRQQFGRSISRLVAKPEYPINDFADDPTMQSQQAFLAVNADADDAVRAGSGFVGALRVPLSRILPLLPRGDMDTILDALDLRSGTVKFLHDMPDAIVFGSNALKINAPSYEVCAWALHRAARNYQSDIVSACCAAAIRLRSAKPREQCGVSVDGKDLGGLYDAAKELRVRGEPVREFVRAYERAEDMIHVHRYLAARKASDESQMATLRFRGGAVDLFLRCGDIDA
jgi:hypothetical protein